MKGIFKKSSSGNERDPSEISIHKVDKTDSVIARSSPDDAEFKFEFNIKKKRNKKKVKPSKREDEAEATKDQEATDCVEDDGDEEETESKIRITNGSPSGSEAIRHDNCSKESNILKDPLVTNPADVTAPINISSGCDLMIYTSSKALLTDDKNRKKKKKKPKQRDKTKNLDIHESNEEDDIDKLLAELGMDKLSISNNDLSMNNPSNMRTTSVNVYGKNRNKITEITNSTGPRFMSPTDPELDEKSRLLVKYGNGKNLVAIGPKKIRDKAWFDNDDAKDIPVNTESSVESGIRTTLHSSPFSFSFSGL